MKRRTFLASATGIAGSVLTGAPFPAFGAAIPEATLLSEVGCGRATGYAEANKIVTLDGKTHVSWLDSPEEGFRVRIKTLDNATGEWSPTYTIGEAYDNHGGPALTMDSEGYLHVAYYPHHHPMRYRKSVRPNDASEWGEVEHVGKTATYPTLVCAPDNTLILTCRESSRETPWVTNLYTRKPDGAWEGPHTIMQALMGGYAHFMDALAWGPDGRTLHLACRMYDGNPGHGHTIGYMKSTDLGQSWSTWDGTPLELPVTAETIDAVVREPDIEKGALRAGAFAVDDNDRPYILCCIYGNRSSWLAYPDNNGWTYTDFESPLPADEGWGLIMPGGITFTPDGKLHVVLTAVKSPTDESESLWGHPACEVVYFSSTDKGKTFAGRPLTDVDPDVPRWLPNMERPTGHNQVAGMPGIIYTEGERGEKNTDLIANDVYWLRP